MTDVTWILIGFVIMLCGFYVGVVRPWLASKLNPEQLTMLRSFSRIAVQAAEQIVELTTGKDKKTYALDLVKDLLAKYKLKFDEKVVSATIEEQVYQMNKENKNENSKGE